MNEDGAKNLEQPSGTDPAQQPPRTALATFVREVGANPQIFGHMFRLWSAIGVVISSGAILVFDAQELPPAAKVVVAVILLISLAMAGRTFSSYLAELVKLQERYSKVASKQKVEFNSDLAKASLSPTTEVQAQRHFSAVVSLNQQLDASNSTLHLAAKWMPVLMALFAGAALYNPNLDSIRQIALIVISVPLSLLIGSLIAAGIQRAELKADLRSESEQLKSVLLPEDGDSNKAVKQFRLHQTELSAYYEQALQQGSQAFSFARLAFFLGLTLFVASAYFALATRQTDLALVTAASGFAVQFVSGYSLTIYKSANESLLKFHNRLADTHNAHLSNLLANQITDDRQKNIVREKMALALILGEIPSKETEEGAVAQTVGANG